MPILNYTTKVDSEKSIAEITGLLTRFGARSITTEYDDDGFVSGISFIIMIEMKPLAVRLPVNVEGVMNTLRMEKVPSSLRSMAQARRVAWRVLKDWLEAQLALFKVGQAEAGQVLMPYAVDSEGRTAYQIFKESHVRQLNAAPGNIIEGNFATGTE
jgi:hypothetical protein